MIDMANLPIPTSLNNYKGIVDEIKETDVLCGSKNTSLNKHHGNALLRQQVNKHLDEYDQADTKQEVSFSLFTTKGERRMGRN